MPTVAPYGSWTSPIDLDLVSRESGVGFSYFDADKHGIYWLESRPQENGRSALVFCPHGGEPQDVIPADFNVRTRVHEYGGGAWFRDGKVVFCSNFDDSRLYRIDKPGAEPRRSRRSRTSRMLFATPTVASSRGGTLIVCVRETHGAGEPKNELVVLPTDGSAKPRVIATGRDFYAAPRPSPDGKCLAWLAWDHPHMPFECTDLCIGDLGDDGTLTGERRVAGSLEESIFQPEWSPDGELHFVSDRTGWWNLYVERDGGVHALTSEEGELGYPHWVFNLTRYAFLADGRIACVFTRQAIDSLELFDPSTGKLESVELGDTSFFSQSLASHDGLVVFSAASPRGPSELTTLDVNSGEKNVLRRSGELEVDPHYISVAEPIEFKGYEGRPSHGFYYPPTNPDFSGPDDELPPLIVSVHGGPTAHVPTALDLYVQYFTSRGIAFVDLNYGGSTGYGREYRDRLRGRWGVVDVEDSAASVRYLAERGDIDADRVEITGGSAGRLHDIARDSQFATSSAAGASYFGVADLVTFHEDTHKFESHYDEYLVGPWPEAIDVYRDRSPVNHADSISRPLLLLQGLDDKVVPPSQSEQIVDALDASAASRTRTSPSRAKVTASGRPRTRGAHSLRTSPSSLRSSASSPRKRSSRSRSST